MSELRTEILVINYARRKSGWSAFGHGFDTRRLHHETLDSTEYVVEGLLMCAQHGQQLDGESPLWAW